MNWLEMQKMAAEKLEAARALQDELTANAADLDAEAIDEKAGQVEALIAEAKELSEKAERLEALETSFAGVTEELADRTAPLAQPDDPDATAPSGRRRVPATARDAAAEARNGFNDFGEFAAAVWRASAPGSGHRVDPRLASLFDEDAGVSAAATGMSQGVGQDGGWTVPPAFVATIWDGMREDVDNLFARTDQYPLDGVESLTMNANAETSRATGSRYGGVRGYWIEEAEQILASKPKVRRMKLEPHQLAALVYVTEKLLMNGGAALSNFVSRACTDELSWLMNDAILNGDGAGKPLGLLNAGCLITVAKETGQAADTFNQENVAKMWSRMHNRSRRNAVWLMNQDVDPQLDLMVTNVKNVAGTENVGGFSAGLYNPDRDTLKGRPIVRTEYNKTLGDVGDVVLADLSAYATAFHRAGISQAMSMHLRFDYAENAFRFMADLDGQPWLASAITPANGANSLSPFVTLAARA